MSQQAASMLRNPHVARSLGRVVSPTVAKVNTLNRFDDRQNPQVSQPAGGYFLSPSTPQVYMVYGAPYVYSTGYSVASYYPPRPNLAQPVRSLHTRSSSSARSSGEVGLASGFVDEHFLPPSQAAYVTPFGPAPAYLCAAGYSTVPFSEASTSRSASDNLSSAQAEGRLHAGMTVDELYKGIKAHLRQYPNISVTWLNRLLAKCNSAAELAKALDAFEAYHARHIDTTAETGTLLIKAACRAGVPERALQLLTNVRDVRLWPTLGGMHYLMINFSLKQDTASVLSTLEATRARRLKPTVRTYHILIRECVDHGHIDRALSLAAQCKAEQLAPNRVMYNILMNGCRKAHKAAELLALRAEMDEQRLDLNETTVKFTVLAHLMLADVPSAVAEFQAFAPTPHAALPFAEKFLEIADEPEPVQHVEYVRTLFTALHEKGVPLEPLIAQLDGLAKQAAAATPAQRPSALEEAAAPAEEEKTANSEPKGRPRSSTL